MPIVRPRVEIVQPTHIYREPISRPLHTTAFDASYVESKGPVYRDIAYEQHPLVEQDEYYRKVVTHPGVRYETPLHNDILRERNTQPWVRAVHYPVATDLYKQVPFKTEYIEKTESMAYPTRPVAAPLPKPSPPLNPSQPLITDIGNLYLDPELQRQTNELYGKRNMLESAIMKTQPNYLSQDEVNKALDDIIKQLDTEEIVTSIKKTTSEVIKPNPIAIKVESK